MRYPSRVFNTRAPLAASEDSQSQPETDLFEEEHIADDPEQDAVAGPTAATENPPPPPPPPSRRLVSPVESQAASSETPTRVRVPPTPRSQSSHRYSALEREITQTLSTVRSWKKKDDIPTTPELTCGQAYGVILGTFLGKMPLMVQQEAFFETMALFKRHMSRYPEESSSAPEIQSSPTSERQSQPALSQSSPTSVTQLQPAPTQSSGEVSSLQPPRVQPSEEDLALAGTSRQFDVLDTSPPSVYQVPSPYMPSTEPRHFTDDCPPNLMDMSLSSTLPLPNLAPQSPDNEITIHLQDPSSSPTYTEL